MFPLPYFIANHGETLKTRLLHAASVDYFVFDGRRKNDRRRRDTVRRKFIDQRLQIADVGDCDFHYK